VALVDFLADNVEQGVHVCHLMGQALDAVVQIGKLLVRGLQIVGVGVGQSSG
jgi:hypothetical protein